MKQALMGIGIGFLAGAGLLGLTGMSQATPTPTSDQGPSPMVPDSGNEWGVVHLYYGELAERSSQSSGSNGRVFRMNNLAVRVTGKFRSFEDGWLRLTTHQGEEVWVPEHAIRAIEWLTKESLE
ncbi:MAG: hypothetical protein Q9O74_06965 [Planctomycetota bacterium]|nr:hypothetical protein [Planctomycetota bacterium]